MGRFFASASVGNKSVLEVRNQAPPMALPSLASLPLHTAAGAPRADPEQESATERALRELRLVIVEQLAQNRGGPEVCRSLASYCSTNKLACADIDVSEIGLSAFGASTPKIRDDLTTVLLNWSRPTPFRPTLSAQQLFSLLCDAMVRYVPLFSPTPDLHFFGKRDQFASSQWKNWYYGLLTLPSKKGVTQLELDCLSGFFNYKRASTCEGGVGYNIGYALHSKRGNWRRIPWYNPNSIEPVSWSNLTDEIALQRLEALGDYRKEFARIREEVSGGEPMDDEEYGFPGDPTKVARMAMRLDFWIRIAIEWFGIEPADAVVTELDNFDKPLRENGTWQLLLRLNEMLVEHLRGVVLKEAALLWHEPMDTYEPWERMVAADEMISETVGNVVQLENSGMDFAPGRYGQSVYDTWEAPVQETNTSFYESDYKWIGWCLKAPD